MQFTIPSKSTIQISLDQDFSERDIDILGEMLRDMFFDQSKGLGCYGSFDFNDEVICLPNETDEDIIYTVARIKDIKMRYEWDGDGYLEFILPNNKTIYNSDCKKKYDWKMQ